MTQIVSDIPVASDGMDKNTSDVPTEPAEQAIPTPNAPTAEELANTQCSACTWSAEKQSHCSYKSNVSLFYSASDRGVWSLGSQFILKERSTEPPSFETANLEFLSSNTKIPIPKVIKEWTEADGSYFQIMERMKGQPLEQAWPSMSETDRERVAKQTAEYLMELRGLTSDRMESLGGKPLYNGFLFDSDYKVGHGPLSSKDQLWDIMSSNLSHVPEALRLKLRDRMPNPEPYTFSHSDLTDVNIMVDNGNLVGIIDWESSGYFPFWWEFAALSIGLGEVDCQWKPMLRRHLCELANLPDFGIEAREFFWTFRSFRNYPDLDERGVKFLKECEADGLEGIEALQL